MTGGGDDPARDQPSGTPAVPPSDPAGAGTPPLDQPAPGATRVGIPVPNAKAATGGASEQAMAAVRLGMVLQLTRRARRADAQELPFVVVNESRQLLPYRQAALWIAADGAPKLRALSGLALPDANAPYAMWLNRLVKWRVARAGGAASGDPERLSLAREAAADGAPAWLGEWKEWVPEFALCAPLWGPGDWLCGYLCLFRENEFTAGEAKLFAHLAEAYGGILGGGMLRARRRFRHSWWRIAAVAAGLALAVLLCVPRPQTALAQAEVAARSPALVRAGVEGVVETFLVEPNQPVKKGDPLLRLDDTQLRTRLAVAQKAEEMARVELRQLRQSALHDPQSKARLPLAEGRLEQLTAESAYVRELLGRVVAVSPMDGVALVDNPDDWKGRPVGLGQKIMVVANPDDVMLEAFLPVADAMPLAPGDDIMFFPNVAPSSPVRARVVFVGYRAMETPGVGMAYRIRAEFVDAAPPLLGLRGTARLSGRSLPLGLIILRRPILAVRQWLGW